MWHNGRKSIQMFRLTMNSTKRRLFFVCQSLMHKRTLSVLYNSSIRFVLPPTVPASLMLSPNRAIENLFDYVLDKRISLLFNSVCSFFSPSFSRFVLLFWLCAIVCLGKRDPFYRHWCVNNWSVRYILWSRHTQHANVWKCVQIDGQAKGCAGMFVISCDRNTSSNHEISTGHHTISRRLLFIQFQVYW